MRRRVLVISGNAELRARITRSLRGNDLRIGERESPEPMATLVLDEPDLVILDAAPVLPRALSTCRMLRLAFEVPVLVMLPAVNEQAEVMCFNAGAADVVTERTSDVVLIARVHALLGARQPHVSGSAMKVGPLVLEQDSHRLLCNGRPVDLHRTELALLAALMAQPRHVIERASLKRLVWDGDCSDRALESAASRARAAVLTAGGPRVIVPMRGIGYRLGLD